MTEKKYDFIVVGSGGGGSVIAWMLAKTGASVLILEQGEDLFQRLQDSAQNSPSTVGDFNTAPHNEYQYRARKPDFKRRPRGDYNTFRRTSDEAAKPFKNGWTGSVVGGGGVVWGSWAYRPLPIDFRLVPRQALILGLSG